MFYRFDIANLIFNTFLFSIMFGALFYIGYAEGTINIERPYLDEYKTCKTNLKLCSEQHIPNCECKCDGNSNATFITFVAFLVMGILYVCEQQKNQKNQKKPKKKKVQK